MRVTEISITFADEDAESIRLTTDVGDDELPYRLEVPNNFVWLTHEDRELLLEALDVVHEAKERLQ